MPLIMAPQGETVQVVKVAGGEKICRHLENLGITVGTEIVLLHCCAGSMIVRVHDSRLAIDSAVARSIVVSKKSA